MTSIKRIQRKRTGGWVVPPNTVYIGRPGKWGNPYKINRCLGGGYGVFYMNVTCALVVFGSKLEASKYAVLLFRKIALDMNLNELKGKNLMCWCREGEPCHGDVLLELANK